MPGLLLGGWAAKLQQLLVSLCSSDIIAELFIAHHPAAEAMHDAQAHVSQLQGWLPFARLLGGAHSLFEGCIGTADGDFG